MVSRRQKIFLTGVAVWFCLDILMSMIGALCYDTFFEANPLYSFFVDSPFLYFLSMVIPKGLLLWWFVISTRWLSREKKNEMYGDIYSISLFMIQFVLIGGLFWINVIQ